MNSTEGNPYSPVGTVLGPGSSELVMTRSERQIAELLAMGFRYKTIAKIMKLSSRNGVGVRVAEIAARIPGEGWPQQKVSAWMWTYGSSQNGRTVKR